MGTLSDEIRVSGIGESTLKKWQEYLVYVLFAVVILVMIFNTHLGELMYMNPAAAVCVLGFTKILSLISWTNNGFIVILLCCTFTAILTTFLSNTGTQAVMRSIGLW